MRGHSIGGLLAVVFVVAAFAVGPAGAQVAPAIQGNTMLSLADGQEMTGDGLRFANQKTGTFIKSLSKSADFELQTHQEQVGGTASAVYNTLVGVKVNGTGSIIIVNDNLDLFFGRPPRAIQGPFEVPGGGKAQRSGDLVTITTAAGDKVLIMDRGHYIDVKTEANPSRTDGDIAGSLGRLDSDTDFKNDLVGRAGLQMADLDAFIEEWRTKDGETMFGDVVFPPANRAPVAQDQSVATEEDTARTVTLTATDHENDALRYKITALPSHGKLYKGNSTAPADAITVAGTVLPANEVTYAPEADYNNTAGTPDAFRFLASDATGDGLNEGTVSVSVAAAEEADAIAPMITTTKPSNKATGVRRGAPLTATFSEKMDTTTITKATFKLFKVTSRGTSLVKNATVGLSSKGLTATLDPFGASTTLLAKNTRYKAVVTTGAEDLADPGNALDQSPSKAGNQQKTWTFTTGRR